MRFPSKHALLLGLVFILSDTVSSLPFRGRSGSSKDAEEEAIAGDIAQTDAVVYEGEIIQMAPSKPVRRNAALEHFVSIETGDEDEDQVSQDLVVEIRNHVANLTDFLVQTRRTLHRRPELMYNEEATSAVVQRILTELGIPFTTGWAVNKNPHIHPGPGGYGVVADIGTGG